MIRLLGIKTTSKNKFDMLLILLLMTATLQETNETLSEKLIAQEKAALEKWFVGNPDAYLQLSTDDVTYFDPFLDLRLDSLSNLTDLYNSIRGQVHIDRYEIVNPKVQTGKNMAVLTYNLFSYAGLEEFKWNCTEVYQLQNDNQTWKIIHTHWSLIKPINTK